MLCDTCTKSLQKNMFDLDFRLTESWGESKNDSIQYCSEAIIHLCGEEGAQLFKKSAIDLNSTFYP